MKLYILLIALLCVSCATPTGMRGISMGDSYKSVLKVLEKDYRITKVIEGEGIRAEGYLDMTKDCRIIFLVFQGKDGLQHVTYKPAHHLSVSNKCQPNPSSE